MNFNINEGAIRYKQHSTIMKYSDSTKKDLISETNLDTEVVFKDKTGEYPDGKIIKSDEYATLYEYEYFRDEEGNVTNCSITKTKSKNGKSIDIEKTGRISHYDDKGRLVKEEHLTRDGIVYLQNRYTYDGNDRITFKKSKGTHTVLETVMYNGQVKSITETTIKSKISHTKYRAYFDKNDKVYKIIDGSRNIETDVEWDLDGDGNILSETKRFFDISTTNKKLISHIVKTYNPAAGYQIASVIKNGIITEEHRYDLKGEEISMYKIEDDGTAVYTRSQKSVDEDTGNITNITNIRVTKHNGDVIKDRIIKTVYDKDNNLLTYAEDNSIVTNYEYDEQGRRVSAITKKLIDEEFVVINEITYTYETDEETSSTTKIRTLKVFNEKGEIISKTEHKETSDETTMTYQEDITTFAETCNC